MKLRFLGVRGSRPTHKIELLHFGGHSTSMEYILEDEDFALFLDGGSGLAKRGIELGETTVLKNYHFLITHTHWDHILGFPFFEPFYNQENSCTFYSSKTSRANFNDLFFGLQRSENLPVPIDKLKADINFKTILAGSSFKIGPNVVVKTYQINHQGITLAYRVEKGPDSVTVVTDNAPIEDGNYLGEGMAESAQSSSPDEFEKRFNDGLIEFLRDCNTVVFDTHFTEDNLKPDWGHSTPERALDFCAKAGVKRLIIFHHAPEDTDEHVRKKLQSVLAEGKRRGVEVQAAKEGDKWILR